MTQPSASPARPPADSMDVLDDPQRLATTPPPTAAASPDGTPVGSRYLLDFLIGQGAWGRVWHGRRRYDNMPVAIKVLRAEYATDQDVVGRLLRERTLLQSLRHPHLVEVEDLVVEGDTFAIVMELVDGVDLRRVAGRTELDIDEALVVLAQVAQALAYIHAKGVLHRDIKPENILVSWREGQIWAQLTDFGLAWMADDQRLTVASRVVGTPAYLAPELLSGQPYGAAVDIYALGVTAYELLCGQRPFTSNHPMALMRAHLDDQPARPPGMTEDTWQVIHACLAKDPQQRPTAGQLASQLENLRDGRGTRLCINFGTCTTTGMLCWPDGRVEPLRFDDSALLPSAVYADPDGTILTGHTALAAASQQPQCCEPYPRLRMAGNSVLLGEREIDAVDLVAAVLNRVAQQAEAQAQAQHNTGGTLVRTTLTHPVTWGTTELSLLLRAAHRAGLPSPQLVAEPVAAAAQLAAVLAADLPADAYAVLYDIGAATTTASVLRRAADSGFHVVATQEVSDAGGIDIDAAILHYLGEIFAQDAPQDWHRLSHPENLPDQRASWQLWQDVQRAKEALTQSATTSLYIPLIDRHVSLDRALLNRLARPILERTVSAVHAALASAGIVVADLTAVFPVGGPSQMPLLADVLQNTLGQQPTAGKRRLIVTKGTAHLPLPAGITRTAGRTDITRTASRARHGRAGSGRDARGRRVPVWTNLRLRHKLILAATVTLAGVATAGFGSLPARSTAGQAAPACAYKIAYLNTPVDLLGGPGGPRGGVALAVKEYNARNPGCLAELVMLTENSPSVTAGATKAASDPKILGVVSALYLSDNEAAQPVLDQAGVPTISSTLTQPVHAPYHVFHRIVGTDFDDVTAGIRQLTHKLNAKKVFVIDDGSQSSVAAAAHAQRQLGTAAVAGAASMRNRAGLPALVNQVATSKADSVYYTGGYNLFSVFVDFVTQLHRARPTIPILGWQWIYADLPADQQPPPDIIHVTCTCIPPSRTGSGFTDRFTRQNDVEPGWYAAEGFDAANVLLSGLAAGRYTRSTMLDWVNRYDDKGVSGHIKFSPTGDLVSPTTWMLRYADDSLTPEEPIASAPAAR